MRRLIFHDSELKLNSASFEHTFAKFGVYVYVSKIHVLRRRKIFDFFCMICPTKPPVRNFKSVGPFLKNRLVTVLQSPQEIALLVSDRFFYHALEVQGIFKALNILERFTVI